MQRVGEVLPRAPLAVVSAEIQYHYSNSLNLHEHLSRAVHALRELLPVAHFDVKTLHSDGEESEVGQTNFLEVSLASRDHEVYATLGPYSAVLAISGGAYDHFDDSFMPRLGALVHSLNLVDPDLQIHRLGMRYIDEIRMPEEPKSLSDWEAWISPALLSANTIFDGNGAENIRGSISFPRRANERILLNWGTFTGSTIVSPDLPFADHDRPPGRIFILDADTTWTSAENGETLSPEVIVDIFRRLHEPCSDTFLRCVTPHAIEYFRGSDS